MKRTIALSLVLLLAVALLVGCSRQAGRVAGSAERTVTGQVTALDTMQRTITVAPQAAENQPAGGNDQAAAQGELFYYDSGTKVTYQGQPSSIDQVQVGSTVRVTARQQTTTTNNNSSRWLATTIEILALPGQAMAPGAASLQGRVVSVNTSANTFTLSQPNLPDQVVQVSPSTTIVKNGQQVQLGSLQAGDSVQVQAQQQGGQWTASSVTVTPSSRVAGSAQQSLQGTVVSVNPGADTFSLRTAAGAQQQVSVPSGATIQRNGQSVPLTSLKPGDRVQVSAQPQTGRMVASMVTVTAPASQAAMGRAAPQQAAGGQPSTLRGRVVSVDRQNNHLTLAVSGKGNQQVMVPPGTSIVHQGQSLQLSQIKPGMQVELTVQRQELVAQQVTVLSVPAAR